MRNLPSIKFKSSNLSVDGIEIIPLKRIIEKSTNTDHDPEKPHQLKFYNIIFFTQGESEQLVDFKWYPVKKNTVLYLHKNQVTAFKFTPNLQGYCILFTQEYLEYCFRSISNELMVQFFNYHLFLPNTQIPQNSDLLNYLKLLHSEFYANSGFEKDTILSSLFAIILVKLEELKQNFKGNRSDSSKLMLISKFTLLVQENFMQNRNAEFYAKKMLITYKHLNVLCKEILNKTAKQFIDDFIILEAKRKLINSEIKSTELAYAMGFEEPTNFTKYFKKKTGITPNSFKKLHN